MPAAPIIGAVAAVAGTAVAYKGYRDSRKAQRQQYEAQQRQQAAATRQSRRASIREAQIARAQTVAVASAQGAMGSSAVEGGLGSIGSQLGSGLGYSTFMSNLSGDISRYAYQAQRGQDLIGLGGTLFSTGMSLGGGEFLKQTVNRPPQQGFSRTISAWTPNG